MTASGSASHARPRARACAREAVATSEGRPGERARVVGGGNEREEATRWPSMTPS
jgi:hypothetical protein